MNSIFIHLICFCERSKQTGLYSKYTYNEPVGQVELVTLSVQACPLVLIIIIVVALIAA